MGFPGLRARHLKYFMGLSEEGVNIIIRRLINRRRMERRQRELCLSPYETRWLPGQLSG